MCFQEIVVLQRNTLLGFTLEFSNLKKCSHLFNKYLLSLLFFRAVLRNEIAYEVNKTGSLPLWWDHDLVERMQTDDRKHWHKESIWSTSVCSQMGCWHFQTLQDLDTALLAASNWPSSQLYKVRSLGDILPYFVDSDDWQKRISSRTFTA